MNLRFEPGHMPPVGLSIYGALSARALALSGLVSINVLDAAEDCLTLTQARAYVRAILVVEAVALFARKVAQ